MNYLVIELFPTPHIITDEEGTVKYFNTGIEAFKESQQCQDGIVIEISYLKDFTALYEFDK